MIADSIVSLLLRWCRHDVLVFIKFDLIFSVTSVVVPFLEFVVVHSCLFTGQEKCKNFIGRWTLLLCVVMKQPADQVKEVFTLNAVLGLIDGQRHRLSVTVDGISPVRMGSISNGKFRNATERKDVE